MCVCALSILPEMNLTTGNSRLERLRSFMPGFMDVDRNIPSWREEVNEAVWDRGHATESLVRFRRSTFPISDDVGYIGYLSDDESEFEGEQSHEIMVLRRREILFKNTVFIIVGFVLLIIILVALPWWGADPPIKLKCFV